MKALDFIYDDVQLSSLGYMICTFDPGSGISTANSGCQIDFETVTSRHTGALLKTSAWYDSCLESTFCICKNVNHQSQSEITVEEMRELVGWLNRKAFRPLRFIDSDWDGIYFMASFGVARCEHYGVLVGLELTMTTDKPYALGNTVLLQSDVEAGGSMMVQNTSDEIGATYPSSIEITCGAAGDLDIYNEQGKLHTVVRNCSAGEVISISPYWQMISSSLASHKVQNDFNYVFPKLVRTFADRNNTFTFSLPCSVSFSYTPVVKAFL